MPTLAELYPAFGLRTSQLGLPFSNQAGSGAGGQLGVLSALMRARQPSGDDGPPSGQGAGVLGSLSGLLGGQGTTPPPNAGGAGDDLTRAGNAIANIESRGSGNYSALGPFTRTGDRAYGRYQVMGANIPEWAAAAGLGRMTPEEFLRNPEAQDAIFRHRFGMYLNRYGPQDAASMWFTGQPYRIGRTRTDAIPGSYRGMTGEDYVNRFMAGL